MYEFEEDASITKKETNPVIFSSKFEKNASFPGESLKIYCKHPWDYWLPKNRAFLQMPFRKQHQKDVTRTDKLLVTLQIPKLSKIYASQQIPRKRWTNKRNILGGEWYQI